jgi:predicted ArsR family transcriptional regulator
VTDIDRPEPEILVEFLRRSYQTVDGLWFMKVEEVSGFDHALEIDRRVWAVVAKIQARKAREAIRAPGNTLNDLARCFALKLSADGHAFAAQMTPTAVRFAVTQCPWLDLLRKSDRQHLAQRISQTICPTEGQAWCAEFGGDYEFEMPSMACAGDDRCSLAFTRKNA